PLGLSRGPRRVDDPLHLVEAHHSPPYGRLRRSLERRVPGFSLAGGRGRGAPGGRARRVFHRQEEGPGTSRGKRRQRLAGEAFVRLVVQEKGGLSVRELPAQL